MQLFYDLLAVSVIYSSSADRIIHLGLLGLHMILIVWPIGMLQSSNSLLALAYCCSSE